MADGMLLMAVFLSACAGFACLALSQRRHWAQVLSGEPPRPTVFVLRTLGSALLLLSLIVVLLRDGRASGPCSGPQPLALRRWQSLSRWPGGRLCCVRWPLPSAGWLRHA